MPTTNLYSVTIPPLCKALANLDAMLDKVSAAAASKATDWRPASVHEEALLHDRIIFDQFDLTKQIQVACDNAKGGAARLAGIEPPKMDDTEKTVAELKARIAKTLAFVQTVKPEQVIGREKGRVSLPYWPGKSMSAFEYATEYLIPNFFFHYTTAYAIIRKNGIDIGKSDFTGELPLT